MKPATAVFPHSKMSELIIMFPNMITVMERMGIAFGFGDQRVQEIASNNQIDLQAFIALLQSFEGSLERDLILDKKSIPDILFFLKASHKHFKNVQIPHIKELIALFSETIPQKHGKMLILFFDGYNKEVEEHFRYEDDDIFPYISDMLNEPTPGKLRMAEFEKNHTDIEQKLLDLKNILIKYIPKEITSPYRIMILKELFILEQDLIYHTFIEDHLLVPSSKQMERYIQN